MKKKLSESILLSQEFSLFYFDLTLFANVVTYYYKLCIMQAKHNDMMRHCAIL